MPAIALCLLLLLGAAPQRFPERQKPEERPDIKLPSGKSQREEILKADHQRNKEEAAELAELTQQVKEELEKGERHVLDLKMIKKVEEIERLARRIKDRLRRHY